MDQDSHPRQMQASEIWIGTGVSAVWFQQRFMLQENASQGWFSPGCQVFPKGWALALGNAATSAASALGAAELLHADWDSCCGSASHCQCIPMLLQALTLSSSSHRDLWIRRESSAVSLSPETGGFYGVLVILLGLLLLSTEERAPRDLIPDRHMDVKLFPDTITFSWYCFHIQDKDLFSFWWWGVIVQSGLVGEKTSLWSALKLPCMR